MMSCLNVANIQHFSVGDGPGIRTTVFLKGCCLHCPWCHNPETISPQPQVLFFEKAGRRVAYGEWMAVETVLERVLPDAEFYAASGGGVTVSGGEPLLQAPAVAELCRRLQQQGIHTLLDTAGCVPWEAFAAVLPYTDCFFYDWKTSDPRLCAEQIGGELDRIAANLQRLLQTGKDVHVRLPLIPGFNDSPEDCERTADILQGFGVKRVDILPFHRLGSSKYEAMGRPYAYRDTAPPTEQAVEAAAAVYRRRFCVGVEG